MKKNLNPPPISTAATSTPEMEIRLVLKIPEFGNRYQVTPKTVKTWLAKGLPHLKLSERNVRIPVREGDAWINTVYERRRQTRRR